MNEPRRIWRIGRILSGHLRASLVKGLRAGALGLAVVALLPLVADDIALADTPVLEATFSSGIADVGGVATVSVNHLELGWASSPVAQILNWLAAP